MLGKRSKQLGFPEADHLYLDYVGRGSFYGFLASLRGQLFRDEDFAELYCPDNGRDSVPPSLVATALLLQAYDKVSDLEAKQRADFDIRWKVALGIEVEDRPFAKSTLQLFRAQLILHDPGAGRLSAQPPIRPADRLPERTADEGGGGPLPTFWVGERSRTPTTCWPTASSRWSGHWPNWMGPGPRSGP